MQSLKMKVRVENNRIAADLPAEVPDGEAELVLTYQEQPAEDTKEARRRHLAALMSRVRQHSPRRSREDIDRQIAEERVGWGS